MGQPVSAILFREIDAQVAEGCVAPHHVGRHRFIFFFELFRERGQFRLCEFARRIAQVLLLVRQAKVHGCSVIGKGSHLILSTSHHGDTENTEIHEEGQRRNGMSGVCFGSWLLVNFQRARRTLTTTATITRLCSKSSCLSSCIFVFSVSPW